jgi:DNA-binding transcriptional LysR family regulator
VLLARLDQEILPELRRLVDKHQQLAQELQAYRDERGGRLRPSAQTLSELEHLFARQQAAIEGVVQQVVDLDANLSGLIQEGDERDIAISIKEWNTRINERWRALREISADG